MKYLISVAQHSQEEAMDVEDYEPEYMRLLTDVCLSLWKDL